MLLFKILVLNQISLWNQDEFSSGLLKVVMKIEQKSFTKIRIENISGGRIYSI